jgi:hypothetical protein
VGNSGDGGVEVAIAGSFPSEMSTAEPQQNIWGGDMVYICLDSNTSYTYVQGLGVTNIASTTSYIAPPMLYVNCY